MNKLFIFSFFAEQLFSQKKCTPQGSPSDEALNRVVKKQVKGACFWADHDIDTKKTSAANNSKQWKEKPL